MNVPWQLGIIRPSRLWISTNVKRKLSLSELHTSETKVHLSNASVPGKKVGKCLICTWPLPEELFAKQVCTVSTHRSRSFNTTNLETKHAISFQCLPTLDISERCTKMKTNTCLHAALLTRRHFAWKSPLKQRGVPLCSPGTTFQHPRCAPTQHDTHFLRMCAALSTWYCFTLIDWCT